MNQHLTLERISRMADGLGSRADLRHAASCARCKKELKETRQVRELTRSLYEEVAVPPQFSQNILSRIHPQVPGITERASSILERGLSMLRPRVLVPVMAGAFCLALAITWTPWQSNQTRVLEKTAPAPALESAAKPAPLASVVVKPSLKQATIQIQAGRPEPFAHAVVVAKGPEKALVVAQAGVKASSRLPLPTGGLLDPSANVVSSSGIVSAASRPGSQNAPNAQAAENTGHPTPVPTLVPTSSINLPGHSQVRNNVARISRGQTVQILFKLEAEGHVKVEVFSRLGQRVAVLADKTYSAGLQDLRWDGRDNSGVDQASGVYQVRIQGPGWQELHKVIIVR
jgi:hypothetical protein